MSTDLLVIGADGFDPVLGEYFRRKGLLPAIDEIASAGRMAPMASRLGEQDVPHTGPAWISLYTGATEREHGVTFGGWLDGHVSFESFGGNTVFDSLVDADYRVGSAFMPITYPATIDTENGSWMISGFPSGAADERSTEPERLHDELTSDFESLQARTLLGSDDEDIAPISAWKRAEERKRAEILPRITDGHPVDVLFYGTQICDVLCHRQQPVPPYLDAGVRRLIWKLNDIVGTEISPPRLGTLAWSRAVRQAYAVLDATVSSLVDRYDPESILIVSDHGFQLNGRDHALLGTSIVTSDVVRPEYITEVRPVIEDHLDVSSSDSDYEFEESELSAEERSEIEGRLEALGYSED